ncbi:MAG TPA: hypothetical protein DCE81_10000, partial [Cytophagales bacterium]|nr:hypothetical protein [Cytophagales bacterium]
QFTPQPNTADTPGWIFFLGGLNTASARGIEGAPAVRGVRSTGSPAKPGAAAKRQHAPKNREKASHSLLPLVVSHVGQFNQVKLSDGRRLCLIQCQVSTSST